MIPMLASREKVAEKNVPARDEEERQESLTERAYRRLAEAQRALGRELHLTRREVAMALKS
jgi:hypothetical protein